MSSSGTNSKSKYQEKDPAGTSVVSTQILHPPALRTTGRCPCAPLPPAKGIVPDFPSHPCPRQRWLQLRDRILGGRRSRAGTDRKEEPGWDLDRSRSPSLPSLPLSSPPMCTHGSCCTSHLWPRSCGHIYLPGCRALGAGEGSCPSPAGHPWALGAALEAGAPKGSGLWCTSSGSDAPLSHQWEPQGGEERWSQWVQHPPSSPRCSRWSLTGSSPKVGGMLPVSPSACPVPPAPQAVHAVSHRGLTRVPLFGV